MSYSTGSHYQPQTSVGDCVEEYADSYIIKAKHINPRNVFGVATWLVRQAKFCSMFEYKVIALIKRKLHIR